MTRKNAKLAVTTGAAVALSSVSGGIPAGCGSALIQADTATIRYTQDGTAPTTSSGLRLINGNNPTQITGELQNVQFIAETGSGNVNVMFQVDSDV